jgi:predicted DNA-binding transcriptional regulator YafY
VNRIDRLTAIIIQLQSKQFVKAEDIAGRFEISMRTVYRDLKALEEAGIPIGVEAGRGYFLVEGYHLPPVMFTHDEANAFILAEKLLERSTDPSLLKQYQSALTKIRAVLKNEEKQLAENLESRISVSEFPNTQSQGGFMAEVLKAISKKVKLSISYHASSTNEVTQRLVEPIGIIYYGLDWHLIAYCNLRKDYRDFKITRIKTLTITTDTFPEHNNYTLLTYYEHLAKNSDLIQVKVVFDKAAALEMGSQKYYHGLIAEKESEKGVEMIFATNSLEYIGKWLLTFTGKVEIVSTKELKQTVFELAKEIQKKYL